MVFYHWLIFLEYSKPPASYLRRIRLFRARLSIPEAPSGNHQKLSVLHARHVSEQPFERQASCHNKLNKVRIANGQTVRSAFSRERLEARFDQAALGRDPKRSRAMLEEFLLGAVVLGLEEEICNRSGQLR